MIISYETFGKYLLDTYDLDPLYVILADVNMPEVMLKRFLLAYWVFYSVGVAAYIAESKDYFGTMIYGDLNHWPRGHERRHMRGEAFKDCVYGLQFQANRHPESVVDYMTKGSDFKAIGDRVQEFTGFGPWISWKVADMTDRLIKPVDFTNAELAVYRDPVKGAALIWFGDQNYPITVDELHQTVDYSLDLFKSYNAPPYQDRSINIQEIETILCKYKSYINGHYPPGLDTRDIYNGLDGWGDLAQQLKVSLEPYYRLVGDEE